MLITGDDVARLGTRYLDTDDQREERDLTPQARPNVLFEAGLGFGRMPERTILVTIRRTRFSSDVLGRHIIHMDDSVTRRQELVNRLKAVGCAVDIANRTDWHTAGKFSAVDLPPDFFGN